MPRGNGKGPAGMGPMTGRATGFCVGNAQAGFANAGVGRGCGLGRGRGLAPQGGGGHGYRRMFFATGLPGTVRAGGNAAPAATGMTEAEQDALRNHAAALQSELEQINQRLRENGEKAMAHETPSA